jgi:N-acetylglutamate synthase-like GNAT family acetyltransferase
VIRRATTHDIEAILTLDVAITGLTFDRAREIVETSIRDSQCSVDVDGDGALIGFVALTRRHFFGRDMVRLVCVESSQRRTGVASALLVTAVRAAETSVVFSSTNESNDAMRKLFAREGWTFSGALTGIDEGDPELVFWKRRDFSSAG